jgi:hypothetical protein
MLTITSLGLCPVFYLKHVISETEFCLCLQVELQLCPIDSSDLCLQIFNSVSDFRWDLLSWAQYAELVSVSELALSVVPN